MRQMSRDMGDESGEFDYAEGWRRHGHLGFSTQEIDPLEQLLKEYCLPYSDRQHRDQTDE
jgi:hypothetical protein